MTLELGSHAETTLIELALIWGSIRLLLALSSIAYDHWERRQGHRDSYGKEEEGSP